MDQPFAYTAILAISGVEMRIRSQVELKVEPSPLYAQFLTEGSCSEGSSVVLVQVRAETAPPNDRPTLFDSGGAWYLQPEGSGYRINLRQGDGETCRAVALSDTNTTHVSVYVGPIITEPRTGAEAPFRAVANPVSYPLDQLLLMNHLGSRGGLIAHSAGVVVKGKALVFGGASGAGKSTICRLFADAGLGDSLLSDDRVIVRTTLGDRPATGAGKHQDAAVWGTPWAGEAQVAKNASAPLGALMFLVKSDANELVPLDAGSAMRRLMPVVSCPWYDRERADQVMATCARIVEGFPCFELHLRPDEQVVKMLVERSWE